MKNILKRLILPCILLAAVSAIITAVSRNKRSQEIRDEILEP